MNLSLFNTANLFESATDLFQQLGIKLNSNTKEPLPLADLLKQHFKDNETFSAIDKTFFIGIIDDSVFQQMSLYKGDYSLNDALQQADKSYEGVMFFALELSKQPSRTEISELTRAFNLISQKMPVALLLHYKLQGSGSPPSGELEGAFSIAISERFKYKQNWRQGEKAGKVIILRDINTKATHAGHQRILLDLVKPVGVSNYAQLHQHWLQVLDVSILNKRFFQELANWYFWAQPKVEFPNDKKLDKDKNIQINLIRLITRLIFVWFLKEKKLVGENIFSKSFIKDKLKSFDPEGNSSPSGRLGGASYYTAILQNLFFATLNQAMNKREFAKDGDFKTNIEEHGVKNKYRYASQFSISEKEVVKLFSEIPFLNGGLFDCLDKENEDTNKVAYIDGFSREPKRTAKIPDLLFFGKQRTEDLTEGYGYKRNKEKCSGIFEIFNSYKFTIEENTPIEEEIALDPELLGKVFENLLAYYNPETETTARKQTGSFYTPREIVNYMVDESLIAYLKTQLLEDKPAWLQLGNLQSELFGNDVRKGQLKLEQPLNKSRWKNNEAELETNLRNLLAYTNDHHLFTDEEDIQQLIYAIDHCKILDPACGSGAFPMGILHKLVYVLGKVDPETVNGNTRWRELQKKKAEYEISKALDEKVKATREEKLLEINKIFEDNASDYGRKLYLIENCIYGVDIQPIAVQISKLRFFISLVVDQKETAAENRGIRPLPNLETKFVAANTLIGLEKTSQIPMGYDIIYPLQEQLQEIRHKHFEAKTRREKIKCQKDDKALRKKIADSLKKLGLGSKDSDRIASFDLYDQNISADFFDAEWMLGIKSGFNIVIGNPPYGIVFDLKVKEIYEKRFPTFKRNNDIYVAFFESSLSLLSRFGNLNFITPNTYLNGDYFKSLRKLFREKSIIREIVDFKNSKIFQDPTVFVSITILQKVNQVKLPYNSLIKISNEDFTETEQKVLIVSEISELPFKPANPLIDKIISGKAKQNYFVVDEKYFVKDVGFNYWSEGKGKKRDGNSIGDRILYSGERKNKKDKSFLKGKDIEKYAYSEPKNYLRHDFEDYLEKGVDTFRYSENFLEVSPKIIYRQTSNKIIAAVDYGQNLCDKTVHIIVPKTESESVLYLVGLLNSQLFDYFYKDISQEKEGRTFAQVKTVYIKQLPILRIEKQIKQVIERIVSYIISIKKNKATYFSFFERLIDAMVYELYLPEAIKAGGAEVLQHLTNLPELQDGQDEKNLKTIEKEHKKLSDPSHPISAALLKLLNVPDVKIIDGGK